MEAIQVPATSPGQGVPRGPGSFCVPRAAVEALLNAKATAYEICAYLVLAKHTDESGVYSPASINAVNKATGANKLKGGPVDRAIARLKTIHGEVVRMVSNGRSGKAHQLVRQVTDLGPILFDRVTWQAQTGEILPDGPTERGMVRYILPTFGEALEDRVWFGNNLVSGVKTFEQPLKGVKNAGDVAARLLLSLYAANDMEIWGGVRPVGDGKGPWKHFESVGEDVLPGGTARLIRSKSRGDVAVIDPRVSGGSVDAYWDGLRALEALGLIYEVVVVLNRNAKRSKFSSGEEYSAIPDDAEPLYELDARSRHGYKPKGEEGLGGVTANTAGALGYSVALEGGRFDGTYAAFVRYGHPAMIAGLFRLRFRVANPKNAGVRGAWGRIKQGNREAFDLISAVRSASKLPPLPPPWEGEQQAVQDDVQIA